MNDEYQCEQCLRIFKKGWSDEEAMKECREGDYPLIPEEGLCLVCDVCFKEIEQLKAAGHWWTEA